MAKAKTATSIQRGCQFTFTNANPPVIGAIYQGDIGPVSSLAWKQSLQGWSYFKESYIDVGGLTTTQDQTIFIASADVQQPFQIQADTSGPPVTPYGSNIYEWYFITDRKMTRDQFYDSIGISAMGNASGVGFLSSEIDQQGVILGFQRTYEPRGQTYMGATSIELLQVATNNFGFSTSTASDRLYCYHALWSYTGAVGFAGTVSIPDSRFIVNYIADKEDDLAYMERLRRSYVQQQG